MPDVQIKKVDSKKDRNTFIRFPWKVYKGDPYWVPPLISDVKERIDKDKHPFFEHADMDLFLAYEGKDLKGRVAAVIDQNHNERYNEKVVFFGFYESIDDDEVAKALLDQVCEWGKEKGMNILRGPVNASLNDECAFLLEGFDSSPVIMMSYNPPYYLDLMEKYGMKKEKDLFAFLMEENETANRKLETIVKKVERQTRLNLRSVDLKRVDEEAEKIKHIYNQGWENNWGFVPWTEKEMEHMAKKLKQIADPDLIVLAEEKNGKPVGFGFALPNYNELLKEMNGRLFPFGFIKFLLNRKKIRGIRVLVFGIIREYRMTGLSYLLYSKLYKNALRKGYQWAETSWQLEDNEAVNKFVMSIGGRVYKKYRIYQKNIG
ncbi:MAG: hypothetical protein GF421_06105 [Candidatus Aminicenantes bacterium]|nr:hypothetical protein [Candidatus Aminicenantes bacterium]